MLIDSSQIKDVKIPGMNMELEKLSVTDRKKF